MKAFLAAIVAIAVVSVGAFYYLQTLGYGSAETFSTSNVRLGE